MVAKIILEEAVRPSVGSKIQEAEKPNHLLKTMILKGSFGSVYFKEIEI